MTPVKVSFAPADAAAAVGRYFYQVALADSWSLDWEFGASSDDEPDAYRNSAASDPAFTVFFFVDTSDGVVKAGIPRGLNFGLKAAVEQYYRKPALVVALLRRFLWVPAHHNVDDYQIAEPSVCLGDALPGVDGHARFPCSGQSMLWATYDLFGYVAIVPSRRRSLHRGAPLRRLSLARFRIFPTSGPRASSPSPSSRLPATRPGTSWPRRSNRVS